MIAISQWYSDLGEYSFPTTFIRLSSTEVAALAAGECAGADAKAVVERLQSAILHMTGASFVGADVCAPTDSPRFARNRWVAFGRTAWKLLAESRKVRDAAGAGLTRTLTVRPFRRMDPVREFRMFFRDRELRGMSQYRLDRFHARLARRSEQILERGREFARLIRGRLPAADLVVDVYMTSTDRLMIVDMNPWGAPTNPLLFRDWSRSWEDEPGLRIIPKPLKMGGDVSVSF